MDDMLIKRRNAVLILLILFLSIAVFSLDGSSDPMALAANRQYKATVILDPGHGARIRVRSVIIPELPKRTST